APAPTPAPAADPSAAAQEVEKLLSAETARCEGLAAIAAQADRLGVTFNVAEAIKTKMSVADARSKVLDAAAAGDGENVSAIATPKAKAETSKALDAAGKSSAWKKALKRH
ncbi:hypothetical protein LB565_19185, partial [Mesorhizobium sp. CA14]|nr:hypothetical protein [Mesorhizobium sp. CA14]